MLVSATGRRHYLDMKAEMLDARKSAEAVRELLEEARAPVFGHQMAHGPIRAFTNEISQGASPG